MPTRHPVQSDSLNQKSSKSEESKEFESYAKKSDEERRSFELDQVMHTESGQEQRTEDPVEKENVEKIVDN